MEIRRDVGCGNRGSRSVDGLQGYDPGGTIDADDMRPVYSKRAVVIRTLPEFTRTASGFRVHAFL